MQLAGRRDETDQVVKEGQGPQVKTCTSPALLSPTALPPASFTRAPEISSRTVLTGPSPALGAGAPELTLTKGLTLEVDKQGWKLPRCHGRHVPAGPQPAWVEMWLQHTCSLQPASRRNNSPPSRSVHSQSEPGPGAGRSRCVRPAVSAGVWTHGCASRGIQGRHRKSSEAGLMLHRGRLRPGDKASLHTITSRESRSPVHCVHLFFQRCTFGQDPEAQLPACV